MRKFFSFMLVAAAVVINLVFWANMVALVAWSVVFLTRSLHSSGLVTIPALSFWQSMGVVFAILSLLTFLLRAGRNNRREGR